MNTKDQYQAFRAEVDKVCHRCGRDPQSVVLVAVSKTVGVPEVQEAFQAGAVDFGENRPDELLLKYAALPQVNWHFIGNVQSRRIPDIVGRASLIHSVYKPDHLPKIEKAAAVLGIVQDILLEVNSGEEAKGGIAFSQAPAFIEQAQGFEHVRVRGLMTMAPQGDQELARACFANLRTLRDELALHSDMPTGWLCELSMGMSEDWHIAIEEGASIIRVGRAIFSSEFA